MPEFSVIIPTYNRALTLGRAIESILNQTLPPKEIIVVNDGSQDNSGDIIKMYSGIKYISQENRGVSAARNRGAKEAIGDWLIFLDSDDELEPKALFQFNQTINNHPQLEVILGGYIILKEGKENRVIPEKGKYIGHLSGSYALKKAIFDKIGGFDVNLKFAENTEMFFRIDRNYTDVGELPFPVLRYYQQHSGGNSNLIEVNKSILHILDKHPLLSKKVRRLYHQILGVNYLRFRQNEKARVHLWKAYILNPMKLDTFARWAISLFPFLSQWVYSLKPRNL